ncbi:RnfABCDGE type electron transport complex subunit D [Candidatus Galacturonibacter soehngenii]|uniref:Ion-translocating oxidoreductase complex subunit D n=1 Tax=Candidatus Galacturonatibacter soehngenii TaxID=2307010 RepID=A0A7V7QLW8_9FIRM|nr:RnfABCDGE type electron transport complex subunit D [Candidatus Galacturonibacter soehngenii]KAB1439433.1 RnfABCDGE type electron transport complex subunit D [Candidatus Galacturonibacter soehngenii]MBA4687297.1 RnfABCDGE type electron transport complex subunit D [Candidatus Galacturonibacter soehngenii]
MSDLKSVSASPHVRAKFTSGNIMLMVFIALLPASLFGIYNFGLKALFIILASVITCVLTEYVYQYFMKKPITIGDYSAAVTGLLLALNLPSSVPIWMPVIGGVFAILVVKQVFGGLGQNFMNPALGARCFLLISFTGRMTNFTYDAISGATPLALLKSGETVNTWKMFLGSTQGTIGETSVIAIMLGAIFLLATGVIKITIPASYILSFLVFVGIFSGRGFDVNYLMGQLCGGGLMLGAWFMATDYVTSPITQKGRVVYGIILGVLTGLFRLFGGSAEGVSYAIIFSNLLVPLIERFTLPTAFGKEKKRA